MTKLLQSIALTRLRKQELPDFATGVLSIVSRYDVETLKIKETFDMLEGTETLMNELENEYDYHPLTKKINAAHKMRIDYADLIVKQMNVYILADKASQRASVEKAEGEVRRLLRGLQRTPLALVTQKIKELFYRIDLNEDLETAFSELNLTEYLNEMRSANASYIEFLGKRVLSIGERPRISVPQIMKEINAALRNLFSQIELARTRNPEANYILLIQELNVLIATFTSKINQRVALNKKKAAKAKSGEQVAETNPIEEPTTTEMPIAPARFTATTNNGTSPENVALEIEGAKNGNIEPLNENKTAAVSTNTTKPAITSTKG